jgi:hypothetical protein
MKKRIVPHTTNKLHELLSELAEIQLEVKSLPPLSDVEKAKLDQSLAIDQLYNSSQIEGTTLTNTMIERAIHGRKLSASQN